MNNLKTSYLSLQKKLGEKFTVMSCRDYGSFYGFIIGPENWDSKKPTYVGREVFCVNKNSKKVTIADISDLSGHEWKSVPVKSINSYK